MMKRSGLVVREEEEYVPTKDVVVEAKPTVAEANSYDEEDDIILNPSKPSHIEFEKLTVKAGNLVLMNKL
jgi:hypothetical protein